MGRRSYRREVPETSVLQMKAIGRWMQVGGLIVLPLAMVMELSHVLGRRVGVADMLLMLLFGFSLFYVGRIVEGYAR